tara:strand:- start:58 stop:561 length:504 start_codon:yes stop_codon:yes gene_type:complete
MLSFSSYAQKNTISAGGQYPPQITKPSLEGRLGVKGFLRTTTFKEIKPVDLFKDFKEGKYSINFNFKANGINDRNIVLFDMKTTVKYNGRTISQTTRAGWPLLPGDTSISAEGFDFIPAIEKLYARATPTITFLPKGTYEIILEMVPSPKQPVKAGIAPATIKFSVQ